MVQINNGYKLTRDGFICMDSWISLLSDFYSKKSMTILRKAIKLSLSWQNQSSRYGGTLSQVGVEIATILFDLQADESTVAAGLVFAIYDEGAITIESIREECGDVVAKILLGVKNMSAIRTLQNSSPTESQIIKFRRMLLTIIEDVRIVLVKLAERVFELRSIRTVEGSINKLDIAQEVIEIYAPLAGRLGLSQIKWELEDRSFFYLYPDKYKRIAADLGRKRVDRDRFVETTKGLLFELLRNAQISGEIFGRVKHIYSIWKKEQKKDLSYSDMYDIRAFRVLVNSVEDCYKVLGILNNTWESVASEYVDYIATPKNNGYQSIHSIYIGPDNLPLEVQIRTYNMHKMSESGVAAHWRYKEGGGYDADFEARISWLRSLLEWQHEFTENDPRSGKLSHSNMVSSDRVYVFTPAGDVHDLPVGSTVLDFAYHVHTMVGHRCKGAKVNGKIVPLITKVKTGDKVEILLNKEPRPSKDWHKLGTKYIFSGKIRSRVARWFKLQGKVENAKLGKERLIPDVKILGIDKVDYNLIAKHFNVQDEESFFASIETGSLRYNQVLNYIEDTCGIKPKNSKNIESSGIGVTNQNEYTGKDLTVFGIDNILSHMAGCCCPVPGDDILGYITRGRGVTIHRSSCSTLSSLKEKFPDKIIRVSWGIVGNNEYSVQLVVRSDKRLGFPADIYSILSERKIKVTSCSLEKDIDGKGGALVVQMLISSVEDLDILIHRIYRVKGVTSVVRVNR